jgi:ABC-type dipeptide/oligopeptide/nickel transport system permease component
MPVSTTIEHHQLSFRSQEAHSHLRMIIVRAGKNIPQFLLGPGIVLNFQVLGPLPGSKYISIPAWWSAIHSPT